MPTYCFRCPECGHAESEVRPMSKACGQKRCGNCGAVSNRDLRAEHCNFKNCTGNWPMESDAAGVDVSQAAEAAAHAKAIGVPTEFNPQTGNPVFTSRNHRKRYCEAVGLYDRNGGYGDPQKRS